MTLAELKALLGIPEEDMSQDMKLSLLLESGILAAQEYCDKLDFLTLVDAETGQLVLPVAVKLGISEWVKANQTVSRRQGVTAESIGGLSQSFSGDATAVFSSAHTHWSPYHSAVRFFPVGRRYGR
ncbi:MAG: phage head-tail connector protein [Exiguobacterium sp.]|nr:phage head-tail connector protein [Exiguobacterium sp.]MBR3218180.1 phage head-tail connector protein [Exiguobacterium sp.]